MMDQDELNDAIQDVTADEWDTIIVGAGIVSSDWTLEHVIEYVRTMRQMLRDEPDHFSFRDHTLDDKGRIILKVHA